MAKPVAPLLSFGASGKLGDTLVYGSWKGRATARRYVIPANPNSSEQQLTRNTFGFLQAVWKTAPSLFTAPWAAYAQGKVLTDRNAFTKFNNGVLREEVSLDNFVASPGALGGLSPASVTPTPGDGSITLAITAPAVLPTGWTIAAAVGLAIPEQSPQSGTLYTVTAGEDTSSTYEVVLSGLTNDIEYQYRAYLRWNRPDLKLAYSVAIGGQSTPTAS